MIAWVMMCVYMGVCVGALVILVFSVCCIMDEVSWSSVDVIVWPRVSFSRPVFGRFSDFLRFCHFRRYRYLRKTKSKEKMTKKNASNRD